MEKRTRKGRPRKNFKVEKISISLPKEVNIRIDKAMKEENLKYKSTYITNILYTYFFAKEPELCERMNKIKGVILPFYLLLGKLTYLARNKGEKTTEEDVARAFLETADAVNKTSRGFI